MDKTPNLFFVCRKEKKRHDLANDEVKMMKFQTSLSNLYVLVFMTVERTSLLYWYIHIHIYIFCYKDALPLDSYGNRRAISPAAMKTAPAIKIGTGVVNFAYNAMTGALLG